MNRPERYRLPARLGWIAILLLVRLSAGVAATITATVTDDLGHPLPDAVVMVTPDPGTSAPRPENSPIMAATIDQIDETFVPSVVVIHTGGTVTFRNSDKIRHHVYSFSPLHRFEMMLTPGEVSQPVRFDQAGSVAIGCNIHDQMIAYIRVTDAPWAVITDAHGQAILSNMPAGHFVATVWHPRMRPRTEPPARPLALATGDSTLAVTLSVLPPRRQPAHDY